MPLYRIHRMKEAARQQFRWAAHTAGISVAKAKDYEPFAEAEATGPYAVWMSLKDSESALEVGDILEAECGELHIYKYVGFEKAQWQLPEAKPAGQVGASPEAAALTVR